MPCCTVVQQAEFGMIERCGKFEFVAKPGLTPLIPCVHSNRGTVDQRVQQISVAVETKTKDNVFVEVCCAVQYELDIAGGNWDQRGGSIYKSFYALENKDAQIRNYLYDVVRACVPDMKLDEAMSDKERIAAFAKGHLEKTFMGFGCHIVSILVTDITPDSKVKNAMNEINSAKRLKAAMKEKAEAEKTLKVRQAEGEAEAKFLSGKGVADQRRAIILGLKKSVGDFQNSGMSTKKVIELVLLTQYFDALEFIGANARESTVMVSHNPGSLSQLSAEMRAGMFTS